MTGAAEKLRAVALAVLMVTSLFAVVPGVAAAAGNTGDAAGNDSGTDLDGPGPAGMYGSGTESDPYVITTVDQLQAMEQDLGAYYVLGTDINASETAGWNDGKGFDPVGNDSNEFIGDFDGRGHTITGMTIDRPTENDVGLFGLKLGSAAGGAANDVENVTLTNVSVVGNEFVGALVGRSGAAYHQHVHVQGTVTGNESVGGIVGGSGQSSIRNVSANVTVSGTKYVGGIIGFGDVFRILDSSVTGSVDGEMAVGGAVGYLDNSDVTENVSSTATVDGSSEVGGLVGLQEGLIRNSSASGTVSGGTNVGGLVGDARGDIVDSQANGTVTGDTNVGGLVGQVTDETTQYADLDIRPDALLSNVSATGTVTGDDAVGGLVGELTGGETSGSGEWEHGRIDNASSTGAVAGNTDTGGLVGMMRASESGSPRIQDSWANGSVTTPLSVLTDVGNIGGLVGYLQDGTVERVWANATLDAEEAVGGLVGRSEGTIRDASATGDVDSGLKSGGLVGNNTGTVTDSTASATVTGTRQVGGLAGANYGTVTRSSSTGAVLAGQQFVGGLIGASLGTTTDSWAVGLVSNTDDNPGGVIGASSEATEETLYWDRNATTLPVGVGTKVNGGSQVNVTGLTTAEMTGAAAASNMSRLDFTSTWATTNRYPQLAFEPAFDVTITSTNEPVAAGENLTVTATVTNTGDVADRQAIRLTDTGFTDTEQDSVDVVLEPGQSTTLSLNWSTDADDVGDGEVTVTSPDATATAMVTVDEPVVGTGPAGMVGSGTDGDPYVITNATQLQAMEQDLDAYYVLGNDIDASETAGWNGGRGFDPVGNESSEFAGNIDGRGHTIAGLTIDRPTESEVGMIGHSNSVGSGIANDELRDFALTNVSVVGNETVGAVFGFSVLTDIESVQVQGTVTGNESIGGVLGEGQIVSISNVTSNTTTTGTDMVGGIMGKGYVRISASSITGSVSGETDVGGAVGLFARDYSIENVTSAATVSGETNVGGLVGELGGDIVDSRATGTVTGDTRVGGVAGQATNEPSQYEGFDTTYEVLLSNVSAAGNVTGNDAVGGLVGELTGGEKYGSEWRHGRIDNASSSAAVVGITDVGGLVGTMRASASGSPRVQDSWANGNITLRPNAFPIGERTGGLVGYLQDGTIEGVWANATVDSERAVGGLVGRSEGTIRNASSTSDVQSDRRTGGLVGNNTGTVVDSTASATVVGGLYAGGLAGRNYGTITRSSSTGPLLRSNPEFNGGQTIGGLVGENRGTTTDSWASGLVVQTTDARNTFGGLIGGSDQATEETLYWDRNATTRPVGVGNKRDGGTIENVTGLTTAEMTGAAAASNMSRLDFTNTWATTNRYPQLAFEPAFDVTVSGTNEPVTAGENLTVTATVTNTGDVADQQAIWLAAGGQERAQTTVVLEPGQSRTVSLNWSTDAGDVGDSEVTVLSPDDSASRTVTVDEAVDEPVVDTGPAGMYGDGTVSNPYVITNLTQLQAMEQDPQAAYALGNDIDASATATWDGGFDPVGGPDGAFSGSLDGREYTISGLTVTRRGTDRVGLFGETSGSHVGNLTLSRVSITGGDRTGGLAGEASGTVVDVSVSGTVSGTEYVGGLVGYSSATMTNVSTSATVGGSSTVGGLVGISFEPIADARASGTVEGTTTVGGLAGKNTGAIGNSTANGPVEGTTNVGGLVGNNTQYDRYSVVYNGTVTHSSATGTVDGATNVGGLVGRNSETISESSAHGAVDGTDSVGGLVGLHVYGTVTDAAASGDVTGDTAVGGLVGDQVLARVSNATAVGSVTGEENVGGLVGDSYSSDIADASAGGPVTGGDYVGGLVGDSISGDIANASSTGTVDGGFTVGGLVGVSSADISNSWASGDVNGSDNVGGLAGDLAYGFASNTSATGNVTGSDRVGGLVGRLYGSSSGSVTASWATGSVTGVNDTGGLVGSNGGTVTEAYCLDTGPACVGLGNDDGVTALETVPMQGASARYTMSNLTFGGPWVAVESGYPELVSNRRRSADVVTIDADASAVAVTSPRFADGTDASNVTVTLVDSAGDPVTGLDASEFGVAVNGSAVTTGISETETGVYELDVTDDVAEPVSVSVTADGVALTEEPTIRFEKRAPAFFDVEITDTDGPVRAGNDLTVTATVTNTGDVAGTQTVTLDAFAEADSTTVSLAPGESTTVDLVWTTGVGVGGEGTRGEIRVTVASANASDDATVTVRPPVVDRFDSTVAVTSPHIANGSDPATVTVSLVNRSTDEPLSGIDPSEFEIDAGNTVVDSGVTETSPGVYEFTLTSALAQRERVGVTVDGVGIDQFPQPEVEFIESGTAYFDVDITDTNAPVTAGETLTVTAEVRNGGDTSGTQNVTLFGGRSPFIVRDGGDVTLSPGESTTVTRDWQTAERDGGESGIVVRSDNATDSRGVRLDIPPKEPAGTLATMAGNGTVENPYVITNLTQLQAMEQDTHANYVLGNDIDASATATWDGGFDPVGQTDGFGVESDRGETLPTFTGSFDGRNHTITGLHIDRPESSAVGLFGDVEYARIENVALVGGNVTGRNAVGALVGDGHDSAISETASSVNVTGEGAVGGLVGVTDGTVTRSYATGSVTVRGTEGGFSAGPAGGLVGLLMGSTEGPSPSVSGLLEGSRTAMVTQSYATANVTGFIINPLVGSPEGSIVESYGAGNTTVAFPDGEQPLPPGDGDQPPLVRVEGEALSALDGPGEIRPPLSPALPGAEDGTATDVYRDTNRTRWRISSLGTGLTTQQMTGQAATTNMTGFDYETTWLLTERYPRLRWSLESVAVSPTAVTLTTGETTQAAVSASFVDGSTETVTATATYVSNDTDVATAAEDGTITAVGVGTTTVTATVDGHSDTATVTVPDRVAPTAAAGDNRTVTVGNDLAFDGGNSTDNVGVTGYQWAFGDGANATGRTVTHAYGSTGTYTVNLTASDAAGNEATDAVTVTVESAPSSGGGGGGSPDRDELSVVVTPYGNETDGGFDVSVENARRDQSVAISLNDTVTARNTTVDGLNLTTNRRSDYRLDVSVRDTPDRANVTRATGARTVGTLYVDHDISDSDIERVTFRLRLNATQLDAVGLDPSNVALYRDESAGWNRLPTTLLGQRNGTYVFEATSPGLSEFALAANTSRITVTGTALENETVLTGEPATVNVTVENRGGADGTATLKLTANGTAVATDSVAVPTGANRTVTLAAIFDEPGTYPLAVNDDSVGDLTVEAPPTPTSTPAPSPTATQAPTPTPAPAELGGGLLEGFLVIFGVVVVSAGGLLVFRRLGA